MIKYILMFFIFIILVTAAMIAHERDIYQQCIQNGKSGSAMWTAEINCSNVIH